MSGKIIVNNIISGVIGAATATIYVDSVLAGTVNKKQSIEIPVQKTCEVSIKFGLVKPKVVATVKNGTEVEIQIRNDPWKGVVFEVLNEITTEYNAPEVDEGFIDTTEKPVYKLDGGVGDILFVYDDRVVLHHEGFLNLLAMGVKGDKTLYYTDITSVQYKRPGALAGHIQFTMPGGKEHTGGAMSAGSDENTITVSGKDNSGMLAEEVVEYINKKIREFKTSKGGNTTVIQQTSAADELKKFKELLDMGIITQEEFDAKKKQLLGL